MGVPGNGAPATSSETHLSPEEAQASSPNTAEAPDQTSEEHQ